ncbi:hypothetical protein DFR85_12895 [Acidianus brierleyi]|nr:hypothetical protein DFR85_12895 [Acidianus brierleyi]
MDKILVNGEKVVLIDRELDRLAFFLQNEKELYNNDHVFVVVVRNDEEEKVVNAFIERSKLQGTVIVIKLHANKQS